MRSLHFTPATTLISNGNPRISLASGSPDLYFPISFMPIQPLKHSVTLLKPQSYPKPQINARGGGGGEEDPDSQEAQVQDLRVPEHWLIPSKALEESEWLRFTLHKWLDDEYCPEETNVEISKVAANSFYKSLLEKQTDLGEILLKMARELESISYQESFHGAFSSANAAVNLIAQRIEQV
ncbi:hypothetical protein F2P56_024761 [Juglans regia]|uniref:Uncharacterized protein n=2 Tax=Juglans regia TaxID=51240 RepID=A0A833UD68_JUGRE|nr:uncharacterized protein LOC108992124 [Juglans regia]KAF5455157.1 hypothetical protein F2P56_024761 [Juglans regia]